MSLQTAYARGHDTCLEKMGASSIKKYIASKLSLGGRATPKSISKLKGGNLKSDYEDMSEILNMSDTSSQKKVLNSIKTNNT